MMHYYIDRKGNMKIFELYALPNDNKLFAIVNGKQYFFTVHYNADFVWKVNKNSVSSSQDITSLIAWFYNNPVYFSATMQALFD